MNKVILMGRPDQRSGSEIFTGWEIILWQLRDIRWQ